MNVHYFPNPPRILVHRPNNPVFALRYWYIADRDCSRIELPRLSINRNKFGRAKISSILHTFLQSFDYYNFVSNISSYFESILKIMNFILFSALKPTKWNPYESFSVSLNGGKKMSDINFEFNLTWCKEIGVEWSCYKITKDTQLPKIFGHMPLIKWKLQENDINYACPSCWYKRPA